MIASFIAFIILAAVLLTKLALEHAPEQEEFDPNGIDRLMDELKRLFDETEK